MGADRGAIRVRFTAVGTASVQRAPILAQAAVPVKGEIPSKARGEGEAMRMGFASHDHTAASPPQHRCAHRSSSPIGGAFGRCNHKKPIPNGLRKRNLYPPPRFFSISILVFQSVCHFDSPFRDYVGKYPSKKNKTDGRYAGYDYKCRSRMHTITSFSCSFGIYANMIHSFRRYQISRYKAS